MFCSITNFNWYATGVYGYSTHNETHKTYDFLKTIKNSHQHDNWLVFGDFNMILDSNEKHGGSTIDFHLSDKFFNTINDWNLNDLGR